MQAAIKASLRLPSSRWLASLPRKVAISHMASGSAPFIDLYQSKATVAILVDTDHDVVDRVWMKLAAPGDELRPYSRLREAPVKQACQPQQASDPEQAATRRAARRVVVSAPGPLSACAARLVLAAFDIAQAPKAAASLSGRCSFRWLPRMTRADMGLMADDFAGTDTTLAMLCVMGAVPAAKRLP